MIGTIFLAMLLSVEDVMAKNAESEVTLGYELVCEWIVMENGDTEWSCSFVSVTESLDISVVGTGAGASATRVYLMCYEHEGNGYPTGNTKVLRVL